MTYDIGEIGKAFEELLGKAAEKNEKTVQKILRKAPNQFQRAAIAFYPKVLKRRSGHLVRSIHGFYSQNIATKEYDLGLRAGGEVAKYARIQHEGGYTKPHVIRPRVAKALAWGKVIGRTKTGKKKYEFYSKGHHVKGAYIKPKKYLWFPLRKETERINKELLKQITL